MLGWPMLIAIALGGWVLASIIVTPLIGYFLFAVGKQRSLPQRSGADKRFRPPAWNYLTARRQENLGRSNLTKPHRRQAGGPRAG
jgi:hypothetical protein